MKLRAILLYGLCWTGAAHAAEPPADFAWSQHPGRILPLDARLQDESGRDVTLGSYFHTTPVILDLGYFHCPSLCSVVRSDLYAALGSSGLRAGKDFSVLAVSIDPAETPQDAARAKQADLAQAAFMQAADAHYLTGPAASLAAIESAAGFRARYDAAYKQFLHPSGIVILTGAGKVSGYVLGVGYKAGDLRAGLLRASQGGIAEAALPILLLCFHFDSTTGRYTLAIEKLLRLLAALTVATLGGLLIVLHRKKPNWNS